MNNLHQASKVSNNKRLTKNTYTQCQASNMAFFVSKIQQACNLLKSCKFDLGVKNEVHILSMDGLKNGIKDPLKGNMFNRVSAVSNTRPPEAKTGGLTKITYGGQTMPNTSKRATIRTISAIQTQNGIIATIHTRHNQKAVIGRLFASLVHLENFIKSQGLSLDLLGGRA